MKNFKNLIIAAIGVCTFQISNAQLCTGLKGPNLLGAKGTFSAPFITVDTKADSCLVSGSNSYNPQGDIGNALLGCSSTVGSIIPCSDYTYTDKSGGMNPEFTYSILKVMGDASGTNCIHFGWKAADHTGDGGYFLAVNGAPNNSFSPVFYQIKRIPVCIGTTYEFSAWVISMIPGAGGNDAASPNISFLVNGQTIANSGPIAYNNTGTWVQVGGSFTATTDSVDLQVNNATAVADGNDLGLDDISIRVCQSQIAVNGPATVTEGSAPDPTFVISDQLREDKWYKFQLSTDGGDTFTDLTSGDTATFGADNSYTLSIAQYIGTATAAHNGYIYRVVVSTSKKGLPTPECVYVNQYRLIVASAGPLPVQLTSFTGTYSNGSALLKWQTSQEINSDRFDLFRSTDGNTFTPEGTVKAAGNSSLTQNYQFKDNISATAGRYMFYKLKQIDKDGTYTFSSIIKLSLGDAKAIFQLYPNPAFSDFTASFTAGKSGTATILIRSTNGQTVYSKSINVQNGNNAVVVTNAQLKPGIYSVTIINDDINYTGKLQKL